MTAACERNLGARCVLIAVVHGAWCMVYGAWDTVRSARFLVLGARFVLRAVWCAARRKKPDVRQQARRAIARHRHTAQLLALYHRTGRALE